jgi:hypothetical protein
VLGLSQPTKRRPGSLVETASSGYACRGAQPGSALLENGTVHLGVGHCCRDRPVGGSGNMLADPRFVNATNDFRLQPLAGGRAGKVGLTWGPCASGRSQRLGPGAVKHDPCRRRSTHRWKLDDGPWSDAPIGTTVALTDLNQPQFFAISPTRLESGNRITAAASPTWLVSRGGDVRINEIWPGTRAPGGGQLLSGLSSCTTTVGAGGSAVRHSVIRSNRDGSYSREHLPGAGHLVIGDTAGVAPSPPALGWTARRQLPFDAGRPRVMASFRSTASRPLGGTKDGAWTLTVPTPALPTSSTSGRPAAVRTQ